MELEGTEYKAVYFEQYVEPLTGEIGYKYVRNYWEDRKAKNWGHLPDLY